jgi:very-short-patch-repair endonuclease
MSVDVARYLRQQSTDAEIRLWDLLRARQLAGYRFRRQYPIRKFIADFACTKYHLIIEADGGQHAENPADAARTKSLEKLGWSVLRFWNNDILSNSDGVLLSIQEALCECEKRQGITITSPSPDDHSRE